MKVRSHSLNTSVARGIVTVCVAVFASTAHKAHAGINVWTSHGPEGGDISALAIDPLTPNTLYAGTSRSGVFKSTDAGATWTAVNAGLPNNAQAFALAIDPITPSTLYAAVFGSTDGYGVFKSTDAGATWGAAKTGLTYAETGLTAR